ncbi:MAG: 50S ribosomal protein L16 [Candidatus Moranbacteria bacterium]|nr:50S ribosomal protein L16 [Candidatus Moranbacteria bacterium]NTW46163.1 50S ribosomal protein L16 [Candidatus Moranbacteria bacterium]
MLMPRKVKHRKMHRGGWPKGPTDKGARVSFGSFGLKATEAGLITARQIEAARRAITRHIQRGGKVWIRVFPDKPMTKKGEQTPMGKGKGAVDHYVAKITAGRVLFELDGVSREAAAEAMRLASHKLSVKTRFVDRHGTE